jgi:ATP-binding cassette subfamily B protein/subfamily B ATP-binding cassette protein MsbA
MKSSRQRFAEFRAKVRAGVLDPDRYGDPAQKREDKPYTGGKHDSLPGGKHVFIRPKKQLLAEYRIMLRGYYGPVAMLLLYALCGACLAPITPVLLRFLVDDIARKHPLRDDSIIRFVFSHLGLSENILPATALGSLYLLIGLVIAQAIGAVILDWLRLLAQQRVNFRLAGSLRQRLHVHLSKLPLSQLADYKTGGIVSRIMGDTDQVVGGVQNAIIVPFNACIRILLTLCLIIFTDWRLSLGAALFIPPVIIIHYFLFKRLRPMWRNIQDDRSMLSARLTDLYGGIRVVRSFRRERFEYKEFGSAQDTMIRKQQFTAILGRALNTGWMTFTPAIGVFIIWYGGLRLLNDQTTVGTLIMYQTLIIQLIQPITQSIDSFQNLQQNLGALDRVIDVLAQPTDMPDKPDAASLHTPAGSIALRDVHFGYKPDRMVLNGITLNVPAGTTMAIVGPSGSGKTTLVNLVARFFDVNHGAVLLDDVDIRDLRLAEYRSLFAMVLQDVYLFDGTVADNIAYGRRHATREEILEAARKANAHDFILELEKGYETIVGERGSKLSGGQKQRISIARAILANPRILILDEATSSLDSQSEHLIQDSLKDLMAHRTTFVIAHRLSTIVHADRIVVLVDGRIVEQGSHDELLDRRGVYHEMFTQQFQRHRDPTLERIDWELAEPKPAWP